MSKKDELERRISTPTQVSIGRISTTRTAIRPSAYPTVKTHPFDSMRIQEVILGVFRRYTYKAMDLDALVHFTLVEFETTPVNFEYMAKTIRQHIMDHFAIHQGSPFRLSEIPMRRLIVCYTIDNQEE